MICALGIFKKQKKHTHTQSAVWRAQRRLQGGDGLKKIFQTLTALDTALKAQNPPRLTVSDPAFEHLMQWMSDCRWMLDAPFLRVGQLLISKKEMKR